MSALETAATVVYDDRPPDEEAHYTFGIDHSKGATIVTRPDLWVGMSIFPSEAAQLEKCFAQFKLPQKLLHNPSNSHATNGVKTDDTDLTFSTAMRQVSSYTQPSSLMSGCRTLHLRLMGPL